MARTLDLQICHTSNVPAILAYADFFCAAHPPSHGLRLTGLFGAWICARHKGSTFGGQAKKYISFNCQSHDPRAASHNAKRPPRVTPSVPPPSWACSIRRSFHRREVKWSTEHGIVRNLVPSMKLTYFFWKTGHPKKRVVFELPSIFSGAILVSGRVYHWTIQLTLQDGYRRSDPHMGN